MEYKSIQMCKTITNGNQISHITPQSNWSSETKYIIICVILAVIALIGVIVEMIFL